MHRSTVAVARELCKSIDIYDQDIHIRSLRTLWYPSSLTFAQCLPQVNEGSPMLAIAEGSQLSIWDLRMNNNGGCVQHLSGPIGGIVCSVCSSPSGLIAIGETDRAVTIYDPRRWSALSRWVGCSKYEITGLSFSSVDQSFIYVQGVDYEITCGLWRESKRAFTFRGDSNWLGFSKVLPSPSYKREQIAPLTTNLLAVVITHIILSDLAASKPRQHLQCANVTCSCTPDPGCNGKSDMRTNATNALMKSLVGQGALFS